MNKPSILRVLLALAVAFYFVFTVIQLVRDGEPGRDYHWDFQSYFQATAAYLQGLNPYDAKALKAATGQDIKNFVYFPVSLPFFVPFTRLCFRTADLVFLVIQCCSLIYLIFLWQRFFLREKVDPWFLLFCLLAFNATVYLDFQAGNVSTIEQALLWTSFYFFLRKRPMLFGLFLVLAAIFKMVLLFFALLILLWKRGQQYGALIAMGSALAVAWIAIWLADPKLLGQFVFYFRQFVSHFPETLDVASDHGITNPAALMFFNSVSISLTSVGWDVWPGLLPWCLYFCWVATVAFISWRALERLDTSNGDGAMLAVNFMCLVFALVSPRFKDYSYIIILLPAYFIIDRTTAIRAYPLGFILCTFLYTPQGLALPGFGLLTAVLLQYYTLALAFLMWVMYLVELYARNGVRTSTGTNTTK
jgi:hypothetical protein